MFQSKSILSAKTLMIFEWYSVHALYVHVNIGTSLRWKDWVYKLKVANKVKKALSNLLMTTEIYTENPLTYYKYYKLQNNWGILNGNIKTAEVKKSWTAKGDFTYN